MPNRDCTVNARILHRGIMRIITTILLLLLCICTVQAATIEINEAKEIGTKLFTHYVGESKQPAGIASYPLNSPDTPDMYIMNFQPKGYIILAAESKATPLLAYSTEGAFSPEQIPANMQWYLSEYSRSIAEIRQHPEWQDDVAWEQIKRGDYTGYPLTRNVDPLCSTTWDQDWPYNASCPTDTGGPGGRVYAGCVAVSMAQIMKKWNAPTQGMGSHSYTCPGYGNLTANFGLTTYNWWDMPNSIFITNSAIATLIYHCGVAVETQYGEDASGALSEDVRDAMVNKFRYASAAVYRTAVSYSATNWASMLRADLDLGRPVYYSGSNGAAGHSWVLDGYSGTNYFHMNWGWGGSYNGYFYLNNLNPNSYNFTVQQAAVMNLYPLSLDPPTDVVAVESTGVNRNINISWASGGYYYKVWRLLQGQENNQGAWTLLTPSSISTSMYVDTAWGSLPAGTYQWAVKAINYQGLDSAAAFSNAIVSLGPTVTQNIDVAEGWNLLSLNVSPLNHALSSITSSLSPNLITIKGVEGVYVPGNPYSTLSTLTDGRAYSFKLAASDVLSVAGTQIPMDTEISLAAGWNMVAYYPQTMLAVTTATQDITPYLMQLKGQDGIYLPGNPFSTLTGMYPGKGYWMQMSSAQAFSYGGDKGKGICEQSISNGVAFKPSSMTMLASCEGAEAGDILLAKVGRELRGLEKFISVDGRIGCLIQIFISAEREEIQLYLQKQDGSQQAIDYKLIAEAEQQMGSLDEFVQLSLKGAENEQLLPVISIKGCYPNPFKELSTITLELGKELGQVKIEVYNTRGQKVRTLYNHELAKGVHEFGWNGRDDADNEVSSGLYFIRTSTKEWATTRRIMLCR